MKKILASLAFLTTIGLSAQNVSDEISTTEFLSNTPITIKEGAVHFAGSAYENDNFQLGTIYKDGIILASNVGMRYNAFRDEMEVKMDLKAPDAAAKVMRRDPAIYGKILNNVFVFTDKKEGISRPGYYVVLTEGDKVALYKKIKKEYIEGSEAMTSLTRDIPSTYKEKEIYYLVDKTSGAFEEFPTSKNAKFNLFKDKKKEIKNYAKEEKLNLNKEWALKKVVTYYNGI